MPVVPSAGPRATPGGPLGLRTQAPQLPGLRQIDIGRAPQAATPQTAQPAMPRPATYDARQLSTPQVTAALRTAMTPEMAALPGRQMQSAGRALGDLGAVAGQIALDIQNDANEIQVRDAVNRARQAQIQLTHAEGGFTAIKGAGVNSRPSGRALSEEYVEKFDQNLSTIAETLHNDAQRAAFAGYAQELRAQFMGNVMRHEAEERRGYAISVARGTIDLETQAMIANRHDPVAVETSVARIASAVADIGYRQSMSAEEINVSVAKAVNEAHRAVLNDAIEREDLVFAEAYMKAHKDNISASVLMGTRTALNKVTSGLVVSEVTRSVYNIARGLSKTDEFGRMVNLTAQGDPGFRKVQDRMIPITLAAEGGGTLQNEKVSPKGARGPMQVMPGTERDPGFGVRPARDDSPEERARVGRDYLGAMLRKYDGAPDMAWAAYNAGPEAVDKALTRARDDGGHWLQYLPRETRNYVTKNMEALNSEDAGSYPKLGYDTALQMVLDHPDVRYSPARKRDAEQEFARLWAAGERADKTRRDSALDEAIRWGEANGGNYARLPLSLKNRIDPTDLDTVRSYFSRVAKGEDIETDPETYLLLANDNYLKGLSDTELMRFKPRLSAEDFQSVVNHRRSLLKPDDTSRQKDPSYLSNDVLNTGLKQRLALLGIDMGAKENAGRVAAVTQYVRRSVLAAQAAKGSPLLPGELDKHLDDLFTRSAELQNRVFGIPNGTRKEVALGMEYNDIPADDVRAITESFKRAGITKPTRDQILGVFIQQKMGD